MIAIQLSGRQLSWNKNTAGILTQLFLKGHKFLELFQLFFYYLLVYMKYYLKGARLNN